MVRATDVCVRIGGKSILDEISFVVRSGEFVVISGRSGSGKSTLLRALCGLLPEEFEVTGELALANQPVGRAEPDLPRRVAFVPQNPAHALFCTRVRDEVAVGPRHLGLDDPEGRGRAALAAMRAEELSDCRTTELSSGQRQRVAIAATLASGPEVVVMDEPTAYLDGEGLLALRESLALLKHQGKTVIVVEHRADRLEGLFDREIGIDGGRLAFDRPFVAPTPPRFPPPPNSPLGEVCLTVANVSVAYGPRTVLRDVSFTVRAGERLAVVGANGSGKSSLARIMGGLQKPNSGRVVAPEGAVIPGRTVGLTVPNPVENLICDTVGEELAFGPSNFDLPDHRQELMAAFDLTEFADSRSLALSLGQQQRLAMAANLSTEPSVLILDEPTTGQDPDHIVELGCTLGSLAARGIATILITHDIDVARSFTHRVLEIRGGQLVS